MRSSRRGNLLLRNPRARGECAVRILFYIMSEGQVQKKKIFSAKILDFSGRRWYNAS